MNLIFGDNQFFGINHMSETKAREQALRFSTVAAIVDLLDDARDLGFRRFMFSSHDTIPAILEEGRRRGSSFVRDGRFYPVIPYAHKYANAVAEKGVVNTVLEATSGSRLRQFARGVKAALTGDAAEFMKPLVDAELKLFEGVEIECVLLQNIVTDLVLGLGRGDLLADFVRYVRKEYGCRAGCITMNPPLAARTLEEAGLRDAVLCFSLNPAGYLMNPGREPVEEVARSWRGDVIAMSVLASGAVRPREAADYLARFAGEGRRGLAEVVYGASTRGHVEGMLRALEDAGLASR